MLLGHRVTGLTLSPVDATFLRIYVCFSLRASLCGGVKKSDLKGN